MTAHSRGRQIARIDPQQMMVLVLSLAIDPGQSGGRHIL
jgi:hypothetical protein